MACGPDKSSPLLASFPAFDYVILCAEHSFNLHARMHIWLNAAARHDLKCVLIVKFNSLACDVLLNGCRTWTSRVVVGVFFFFDTLMLGPHFSRVFESNAAKQKMFVIFTLRHMHNNGTE